MRWPLKYPREPGTGSTDDLPPAMEVFYLQSQAYTDPQLVQDRLFSRPRSPAHSVLPESSLIPAIMQPNCCRIEPTFRHSPILQHVFFATVPTDPRPEASLTFLILVIYNCCPDLDGCG